MPHLRELVKLYEGRPFAIVGVNSFDDEKTYHEGVEKYELSWISAFQGQGRAPISTLYRVEGYPTVVLVDHEGKIRFRGHHVDDASIAKLVADAEAGDG